MLELEVQPRGTEGLSITSPDFHGFFSSRRGLWRDSGHSAQQEPHEEPAHGNSSPKAVSQAVTNPVLNMKGWTFLQALPIPSRATTLWSQRECRKAAAPSTGRGIGVNFLFECGGATSIPLSCPGSGGVCARGWSPPVQGSHAVTSLSHSTASPKGTEHQYTKVWVLIIAFGNHGRSHSLWSDSAPCHLPTHRVSFFPEPLTVLL